MQHLPLLILAGGAFLVGVQLVGRSIRQGHSTVRDQSPNGIRQPVIALLLVAAAAHVPVISEHLEEAPYMGYLFIGFTLAAFGLATALAVSPSRTSYLAAAGLCTAAVAAYAATRLVAFPQLADDVGMWAEPLGLLCIATEAAAVTLSLFALRRRSAAPHVLSPA